MAPVMTHETTLASKTRAFRPKPLHSRLGLQQSRKTHEHRLELFLLVWQKDKIFGALVIHITAHSGDKDSVPGRSGLDECSR